MMEKWEKSNEIDLPKHSSRTTPFDKSKFFTESPLDVHEGREALEKEKVLTEAKLIKGYNELENKSGITQLEEILEVLEKEKARVEDQIIKGHNGVDKKAEIARLEGVLKDVEDKLERMSVSEEPKGEKVILASAGKDSEPSTPTQKNAETPHPAKSPIENGEYVTVNKGVVKQVNPARLINVSMKDFEGTPIDRNNLEKREKKELNDAREKFALADKEKDPEAYEQTKKEYDIRVDTEKDFIIKHKKLTLETKGLLDRETGIYKKLTSGEVQYELDKYIKVNIAPHFAVVEAARIQEARTEPSFIEKMKGSEWGSFAGKLVDGYRKLSWKKKLLVSAGLLGVGVTAGAVGGTFGIAVAGIVTGGKGIQRIFSGAGTAVGIDAWIQKSQQKWMSKEGWGRNRHEYISKQISLMREKIKSGDDLGQDIKKSLEERTRIEKMNEIRRTGLAAIAGVLVGSGAAFRVADEYLGISDKLKHLFGGEVKVPTEHHTVATGTPPIAETIAPANIKPIELSIGTRGPEGALIDEFRNNPEIAKKFGWLGGNKEDLSKWAGSRAHILWGESAKQALLDPSVKQELAKFGYPETAEGYEKAMTRIGKGIVSLDIDRGSIKLDTEYLKNIIPSPTHPSIDIPHEELVKPGVTVNYDVGGVHQTPLHTELVGDTTRLTNDLSNLTSEELQRQMETPEGKLNGLLVSSRAVRVDGLEDFLKRQGGIEKLLKMPVRELYGIEQGYPRPVQLDRLYEGLQNITGDARLDSNDTLEDVLKSIESKSIFHGTAREILGEGIHNSFQAESIPVIDHTMGTHIEASAGTHLESEVSTSAHTEAVAPPHTLMNEVITTKEGIKGIFSYDSSGKITGIKPEGFMSPLQGKALLKDNYEELMKNKGAKLFDIQSMETSALGLSQREQILKTLEESGQGKSDKAEFLRKIIKNTTDQIESKYGKIFR